MAFFTLNTEDKFEGGLKDGTYEVVVTRSEEKQTQSGADYVEVTLTVRNDVNQPSQNALIFHKIWKTKATGQYNGKAFNTLGDAFNLQNGKNYNSLDELLKDFIGKTALVTVKNETSNNNGQTYTNVNVKRWEKSKFPNLQHVFKNKTEADPFASIKTYVEEHDLPF